VVGSGGNGLVNVTGNLTLAGTLNVTDGGNFGAGAYRLLNYGGVLTNEGLALGTLPTGFTETVSTAVAGQVNLVVSAAGSPAQFWDGTHTGFDTMPRAVRRC
jgi:fibronectin-binding autotransporter adhesin